MAIVDDRCEPAERAALALLPAFDAWGRARRAELAAIEASRAAEHRGPDWFARCVAGETRQEAERALFAAWEGAGR